MAAPLRLLLTESPHCRPRQDNMDSPRSLLPTRISRIGASTRGHVPSREWTKAGRTKAKRSKAVRCSVEAGEFSVKMTSRGIVRVDDPVERVIEEARETIGPWHKEMVSWRRAIHSQPELAFQEERTSDMVASLLQEWGYQVDRSLGGTGIVATLSTLDSHSNSQSDSHSTSESQSESGSGSGAEAGVDSESRLGSSAGSEASSQKRLPIMLRADMDALPIQEHNEFEHRSTVPSCMHACGHDGHTAMLLGAARHLSETRNFSGTVHLVFQPAEEGTPTVNKYGRSGGGALAMLEDGLLQRYPVRAVFGMHNWPGLPAGRIAVHSGPVMAGVDNFDIIIKGEGCHAGMPHLGRGEDPLLCASFLVGQLQSIVSRAVDPCDRAVVSVTQFHSGDAYNVIPPHALIRGTIRTFSASTREMIMERMAQMAEHTASAHGCKASTEFRDFFPATVNTPAEAKECAKAASDVLGLEMIDFDTLQPSMGAEDFGYILQRIPGCYVWIGNGPTLGGCMLHNPLYDFNDDILPLGAAYWVKLVENALPKS